MPNEDSIFNTETFEEMNVRVNEDIVKHPSHYTKGIEMWEYAYSQNLNFFEGNIIKYVTRWRHKNGIEDLLKAKQYLDKLIEKEQKLEQDISKLPGQ